MLNIRRSFLISRFDGNGQKQQWNIKAKMNGLLIEKRTRRKYWFVEIYMLKSTSLLQALV